ncbi:YidC/Oxa1 family membrane protein insertase [Microbacterium gorillae]|uniref:YidC/Oxa1 family membrane protein insertase n=1 Tax=Microbacterium gorillae TaxID=1231063 RepID=UPI00059176C7|nr:YidC/Oxa1 family membrane protein insertase [Microbacterium gorillae]
MDIFAFPPLAALLDAAYSGLIALADLLEPAVGVSAAALAVILVTLLVRACLIPVGVSQAKAEQMRARLAPRLRELQARHKKNPERLQRETMKLYTDENTSPFAGCLPLLAQAPVVGLIYTLFLRPEIAGHPNALLAHQLAGVPLGTSFVGALGRGSLDLPTVLVVGTIVAIIAVVGELTRRAFRPTVPAEGPLASSGAQRMLGALQYLTAVFALFVPVAAGLYLATTVAWTLAQRVLLRRRHPLPAA